MVLEEVAGEAEAELWVTLGSAYGGRGWVPQKFSACVTTKSQCEELSTHISPISK